MFYQIGPHTFRGLPQITKHARLILQRAEPGNPLAARELEFVVALLQRHPGVKRKTGAGIKEVFVRVNWKTEGYENRCFWIRRIDGSETDFSYTECINPTDHKSKFIAACRVVIRSQIKAFRESEVNRIGAQAICPVTGREFSTSDGHVDHEYPNTFESLIEEFIETNAVDITTVEIITGNDGQLYDVFASESLASSWAEFHRAHAVLRLLPGSINQRLGNRGS